MKKELNFAVSEMDVSDCRKAKQQSPAIMVHVLLPIPIEFRLPCENRSCICTTPPWTVETWGGLCVKWSAHLHETELPLTEHVLAGQLWHAVKPDSFVWIAIKWLHLLRCLTGLMLRNLSSFAATFGLIFIISLLTLSGSSRASSGPGVFYRAGPHELALLRSCEIFFW